MASIAERSATKERPIQIIRFINPREEDSKVEVIQENLDDLLSRTEGLPLCIISICGPSRQGKSFLLGYVIRYLQGLEIENEDNWMLWETPNIPLEAFKFKNGYNPTTQGIWAWSKPFITKIGCERLPTAILVLDTQGTYDEKTSEKTMASILGVSMLMSSCVIFNIFKVLQEDVLMSLNSYIEFGQMALQKEEVEKPFQKLSFLIRDWNNPTEYPYGAKGGKSFLKAKLAVKDGQSIEAQDIRKTISSCFEHLDCYLLPHPGENAIRKTFRGSLSEVSEQFSGKLEEFITSLVNRDQSREIFIKRSFGKTWDQEYFRKNLATYVSLFNSADIPTPTSIFNATVKIKTLSIMDDSVKTYKRAMKKMLKNEEFISPDKLSQANALARKKATDHYNKNKLFGRLETSNEKEFFEYIDRAFREFVTVAEESKSDFLKNSQFSALQMFEQDLQRKFSYTKRGVYYSEHELAKHSQSAMKSYTEYLKERLEDAQVDRLQVEENLRQLSSLMVNHYENEYLLVNSRRENEAKLGLLQLSEYARQQYINDIERYIRKNPFVSQGLLSAEHRKICDKLVEDNKDEAQEFFPKNGKTSFVEDLKSKLDVCFAEICKNHLDNLAEYQHDSEKKVAELVEEYKVELEKCQDDSKLKSSYRINKLRYLRELRSFLPYPTNSNIAKDFLSDFESRIDNIYAVLRDALLLEPEETTSPNFQNQETLSESEDEFYEAMEVEEPQNLENKTLNRSTVSLSYMDTSASAFDDIQRPQESDSVTKVAPTPRPRSSLTSKTSSNESLQGSPNLQKIGKRIEDTNLSEIQERLKNLRTTSQDSSLTEAQLYQMIQICLKSYNDTMNESVNRAKTKERLTHHHEKAQKKSVDTLKSKTSNHVASVQRLKTLIRESFEGLSELYQMNDDKEVGLTDEIYAEARKFYNSAMEQHLENSEFIQPQILKTMHDDTVRACVEKLVTQYSLKINISEDIKAALEPAFKKWNDQNDMNLNFDDVAIGIDLGTTYSCVAAYISGKIRIIENDLGKRTTPSYVAFQPDGSEVVGNVAKQRAHENPENTIFDAKRIIGRKFTDPDLKKDMELWPFTVIDDGGIPKIKVGSKTYYPEQISASVLQYLKESAEKFLGKPVNKAVITVPAYFNDGQRQATIDAGELAGLEVLSILTEPVAAAIAYKKQHADNYGSHASSRNILIFDLGGGTFDVAILQSKHGELNVLAVDGNDHLGGEDFDRALMHYCAKEFKKQTQSSSKVPIDLFEGKDSVVQQTKDLVRRRLKRLQGECERRKIDLTSANKTEATLDNLVKTTDLSVEISRSTFEAINKRTFDSTIEKVVTALKTAKLDKHEIHDIVLVGGSTRIPKIQEILHNFFGKTLDSSINPDEAVAYGAAMQAAMMNGAILRNSIDFTKIKDVTPMSIGVEVYGGDFSVIIPKNTKIPVQAKERYLTAHNNQTSVQITIYQGEDPIAVNNKKLGDFYLNGIPPKDAEKEDIDVEMTISSQGILHVNAASSSSGAKNSITVTENKQRMTKTMIKKLLGSA